MDASGLSLPHPLGFVLGGGATLGAIEVGMVQALSRAGCGLTWWWGPRSAP